MMMHLPITNIDDVLPHIAGRTDFVVAEREGYRVVDYLYASADTFDHPMRVECRGLKFDDAGDLIARPLHKFFNVNERPDTQSGALDFSQPHVVMDKLDGSMIHPSIVGGELTFMTRMGRSDVAKRAERHLDQDMKQFCEAMLDGGATPIFEWTAPDNRIVIKYDDSALTLLAIRNNESGAYWSRADLERLGIPLVAAHSDKPRNAGEFLEYARAVQDAEGFVVKFDNGLWVKVKAEDYVTKHKAKDSIVREKNILALILSGGLDDVFPLLSEEDADTARAFRDDFDRGVAKTASEVAAFVNRYSDDDQKTFAVERASNLPPLLKPIAFTIRKGVSPVVAVRNAININSQAGVDQTRELHGAHWGMNPIDT